MNETNSRVDAEDRGGAAAPEVDASEHGSTNRQRAIAWLGWIFVFVGLGVNRFTLATLSPDGAISGVGTNAVIVAIQLWLVAYGVYSIRTRRGLIVEFSLLAASIPVAFLLLEFVWRVYLFGGAAFSYSQMNSLRPFGKSGMLQASDHAGVVFELRPFLDQPFKLVDFRTNSVGLRDREYDVAKPPATFRVAVIGDSYTMAEGVSGERAFSSLLEERLNAAGHRAEVLNFGVGGYTLLNYLAVLEEKALAYDPDLVVIGFCPENDHKVPPPRPAGAPFVPREPQGAFWRSHLLHFFRQLRAPARPTGVSAEQIEYMREAFHAIGAAAASENVPVVVAYLSNRPSDASTVRSLVGASDLYWVHAGRAMAAGDLRDYSIYFPLDTHPNEAAHEAFADALYTFIADSGLAPPR